MSTFAILIGVALAAQVAAPARYGDANNAAQTGANPQKTTAAILDDYGAQTGSSQPGGAAPINPPAASGQAAGGVYSGLSNGAATGASTPAGSNSLGGVYSPGKMQPPPGAGGASPLGGSLSGTVPIQSGTNRDLNAPPASAAQTDTIRVPAGMMRAMLVAPANSRLSGEWLTLDEVVAGAQSRDEQSERIEAYWDLCSSIADYFLGLREQEEMGRLKQWFPRTSAALDQAENDLKVRVGTAERGARASQLRLASMIGRGADRLPLPGHPPHCGSYQTRHQQVFAGRSSAEADELSQLIPLRYSELQDACAAVTRLQDWFVALATSRAGAVDEETVLRSLELLALERRAFVQIARDYNRRISRYVELAAPGQVESDRLIGMLIKRDRPATATRSSSPGPPPNRQTQTGPDGRQTFADGNDGWTSTERTSSTARRDEDVTPASAEVPPYEPGERSLLVAPKR